MWTSAILKVGLEGAVADLSDGAQRLFGSVGGRQCWRVLSARTLDGQPVCSRSCGADLVCGRRRARASQAVVVRGRIGRLVCDRLGRSAVVSLHLSERRAVGHEPLTPRERQVLALVAEGLSGSRISRRLGIQPSTVRTHVEHARDKLGATTRAQAVACALAQGWL